MNNSSFIKDANFKKKKKNKTKPQSINDAIGVSITPKRKSVEQMGHDNELPHKKQKILSKPDEPKPSKLSKSSNKSKKKKASSEQSPIENIDDSVSVKKLEKPFSPQHFGKSPKENLGSPKNVQFASGVNNKKSKKNVSFNSSISDEQIPPIIPSSSKSPSQKGKSPEKPVHSAKMKKASNVLNVTDSNTEDEQIPSSYLGNLKSPSKKNKSPIKIDKLVRNPDEKSKSPKKTVNPTPIPDKKNISPHKSAGGRKSKESDNALNNSLSDNDDMFPSSGGVFQPLTQVSREDLRNYQSMTDDEDEMQSNQADTSGDHLCELDALEDNDDMWTEEQLQELIDIVAEKTVSSDHLSYRGRLGQLNFSHIALSLNPQRTSDAVHNKLATVCQRVRSTRNLFEMMQEAKRNFKKVTSDKKSTRTPLARFISENQELIKKIGGNVLVTGSRLFKELPAEERTEKYEKPYQQELEIARQQRLGKKKAAETKKTKKSIITPAPCEIFFKSLGDSVDKKEAREKYDALSDKKKLKHIKLAVNAYLELCSEETSDVDNEALQKQVKPKLNKDEWNRYFLSIGMPVMSAKTPYHMYLKDNPQPPQPDAVDSTGKFPTALRRYVLFRHHSDEYTAKFTKEYEEVLPRFEKWKEELPEPLKAYSDVFVPIPDKPQKKKELKPVRVSPAKKPSAKPKKTALAMKMDQLMTNSVNKSFSVVFPDEPVPKPCTTKEVFKVYVKLLKDADGNALMNDTFISLADSDKQKIENIAARHKKEYKENLLEFVKDLNDEERKTYIGQNRMKFLRLFGTDIFETDYPVKHYPAFIPISKTKQLEIKRKSSDEANSLIHQVLLKNVVPDGDKNEAGISRHDFKKKPSITSTPMVASKEANDDYSEEEDDSDDEEDQDEEEVPETEESEQEQMEVADENDSGMEQEQSSEESIIVSAKVNNRVLLDDSKSSPKPSSPKVSVPTSSRMSNQLKSKLSSPATVSSPGKSKTPVSPKKGGLLTADTSSTAESSDESSDEDEMPQKPTALSSAVKSKSSILATAAESSESDSSDEDESSDDQQNNNRQSVSATPAKPDDSSDSDDSEVLQAWK